ncbi:MAG: hypothetical protein ABIN67_13305 [Ferruginibacter sp.]
MENITTQQEILIVTGTGFASRQYSERDEMDNSRSLSPNEKLQEACWNGQVQEMIPEIFYPTDHPVKLYLWQLKEASHFLSLELGECPSDIDSYLSIDPYLFLMQATEN